MPANIQILPPYQVDKTKWDACVAAAGNGLIYSCYDYLDHMCSNWSGLIVGDYNAVMPLPWRKKFGIRYIYQPSFIQQLGLIGTGHIDISYVSRFARYGDLLFNFGNEKLARELGAVTRSNFILDLSAGYDSISSNYRKDLVLNLKKAKKESLELVAGKETALAVKMYKLLYKDRTNLHDKDYLKITSLADHLSEKGMCFTRKIQEEKGALLAIGLFLTDGKRIYNLMNSTTDVGRAKEANHFLLDSVIKEFSGQSLLFDFEGSDVPGIKNFYEKFGAVDQPYFYFHYNRLPLLLKSLKR